jgi:hypothetical protein
MSVGELGQELIRLQRGIAQSEVAKVERMFADGTVDAVEGSYASVRIGDPSSAPIPGFYVDPSLAVVSGDHVLVYRHGGYQLILAVLNRNAIAASLTDKLDDQVVYLESYAVGDGATDDTAAIIAAATESAASGRRLVSGPRTYLVSETVTLTHDADLALATFRTTATDLAPVLSVGVTGSLTRKKLICLPAVLGAGKSGLGNGTWGSDIGVRLLNVLESEIHVRHIQGFGTGLSVHSDTSGGSVYNNIHIQHLDNNKINLSLTATGAGWTNENNFYGGRFSMNSGEGSAISGARHIFIGDHTNPPNHHRFYGQSIEAEGPEYHVECQGPYNYFTFLRWEASPPKALFTGANSFRNAIILGYNAHSIVITLANGGGSRLVRWDSAGLRQTGSGTSAPALILANPSGDATPVLVSVPSATGVHGSDPNADYGVRVSHQKTEYKATADASNRVEINHATGQVDLLQASVWRMLGGGYIEIEERGSSPSAPAADRARLFVRDNGAGKTELVVRFPTGSSQVIATEP